MPWKVEDWDTATRREKMHADNARLGHRIRLATFAAAYLFGIITGLVIAAARW